MNSIADRTGYEEEMDHGRERDPTILAIEMAETGYSHREILDLRAQ
jgi:hypothetical protein